MGMPHREYARRPRLGRGRALSPAHEEIYLKALDRGPARDRGSGARPWRRGLPRRRRWRGADTGRAESRSGWRRLDTTPSRRARRPAHPGVAEPGPQRADGRPPWMPSPGAFIAEDTCCRGAALWRHSIRARAIRDRSPRESCLATDWGTRLLSNQSALYEIRCRITTDPSALFTGLERHGGVSPWPSVRRLQALMANAPSPKPARPVDHRAALGRLRHALRPLVPSPDLVTAMVAAPLIRGLLGSRSNRAARRPLRAATARRLAIRHVRRVPVAGALLRPRCRTHTGSLRHQPEPQRQCQRQRQTPTPASVSSDMRRQPRQPRRETRHRSATRARRQPSSSPPRCRSTPRSPASPSLAGRIFAPFTIEARRRYPTRPASPSTTRPHHSHRHRARRRHGGQCPDRRTLAGRGLGRLASFACVRRRTLHLLIEGRDNTRIADHPQPHAIAATEAVTPSAMHA